MKDTISHRFHKILKVVLKFEMLSHLLDQSFGLNSYIRFEHLSLILSLRAMRNGKGLPDALRKGLK